VSTYLNTCRHVIDVPGGALVAPGTTCELEDEAAEELVRNGLLVPYALTAPAKKSSSASKEATS
jgi:hypothetical protein